MIRTGGSGSLQFSLGMYVYEENNEEDSAGICHNFNKKKKTTALVLVNACWRVCKEILATVKVPS